MIENNKLDTILIASYRKPYKKDSLKDIENILKKKNPNKVIILCIAEKRETSGNIESYLGTKDLTKFQDKLKKDQYLWARKYTEQIKKICNKLDIDFEVVEKEGDAAEIILKEAKKYEPSHIVIHQSDKSRVDKKISGSVMDVICDGSICRVGILE